MYYLKQEISQSPYKKATVRTIISIVQENGVISSYGFENNLIPRLSRDVDPENEINTHTSLSSSVLSTSPSI